MDQRYRRMRREIRRYGAGGRQVLRVAWQTLRRGVAAGKWSRVGLEDLWTHALQEGRSLFRHPRRLWGPTSSRETGDMLGQTTIGPWQITLDNIRQRYGRPYGVRSRWSARKIVAFCRARPRLQAAMIADYIERSYVRYGRRSPYGIQRYFWLEGYVKGWIGQGRWFDPPVPSRPSGGWRKLTATHKRNTGFYAQQILLGTPRHPFGLVFWLWVSGDRSAIRNTLVAWRQQPKRRWDDQRQRAIPTKRPGRFGLRRRDLRHLRRFRSLHAFLRGLVK